MLKYLFILFLFGCSPLRPWKQVASDPVVTTTKKNIISAKVASMFPAQTKYLPGETIIRIDTVFDIEETLRFAAALDSLIYLMSTSDTTNTDSITTSIVRRFKPRNVRSIQIRIDTVQVPETAKIYGLIHDLEVCETTNIALQTTNEAYLVRNAELSRGRNKWLWWLIALAAVNVIFIVYKVFRR